MIWLRLISWVIGRGLVSGAVVGAILGALLAFVYGAFYGLVLGGIIGAILGFLDGVSLALITKFTYSPPKNGDLYPRLVYAVPILINTAPIFIICLIGVFTTFSWDNAIRTVLISSIPIMVMGLITAYFAGLFLEFADWLIAQTPSRNTPANDLLHIKN